MLWRACTGHSVAAGAILLMAGDLRIGAEGDFKIGLNETAIGLPLPAYAIALAQARMPVTALTASARGIRFSLPAVVVLD